jgi:hypothetical protein
MVAPLVEISTNQEHAGTVYTMLMEAKFAIQHGTSKIVAIVAFPDLTVNNGRGEPLCISTH